MMATPTLRRFKMIWGPTPQAHILINACSLYCSKVCTIALDQVVEIDVRIIHIHLVEAICDLELHCFGLAIERFH